MYAILTQFEINKAIWGKLLKTSLNFTYSTFK